MRLTTMLRASALAAVLILTLAACGDGDGGGGELGLVSEGTLTVCTDAPYPPMEFEENGEFTGFDIELVRAIAEEMGLDGIEVINSGFDPITSGAVFQDPKQCDVAAASITITEDREGSIDFSDPYFDADQSLLVKTDSGASSLEDLAGERIGVQSGTTGETYAQENTPEGAEIVSFDEPGDMFVALEAGDIVAVLQDIVVNQGRALEDDSVEVAEAFPTDEQYGFAFAEEGSDPLQEAFNEALSTLQDDGSYDQIFDEWFPTGAGA
ncbi:MAG: transporter substrate-binding domain-containing protein [Nitriliruptorales bacterium]